MYKQWMLTIFLGLTLFPHIAEATTASTSEIELGRKTFTLVERKSPHGRIFLAQGEKGGNQIWLNNFNPISNCLLASQIGKKVDLVRTKQTIHGEIVDINYAEYQENGEIVRCRIDERATKLNVREVKITKTNENPWLTLNLESADGNPFWKGKQYRVGATSGIHCGLVNWGEGGEYYISGDPSNIGKGLTLYGARGVSPYYSWLTSCKIWNHKYVFATPKKLRSTPTQYGVLAEWSNKIDGNKIRGSWFRVQLKQGKKLVRTYTYEPNPWVTFESHYLNSNEPYRYRVRSCTWKKCGDWSKYKSFTK